jgi:acyl-CoA-dependent ceramide synthase
MGTVVFTKEILGTFVILLLALQVLTLMWFYMILRVAWKVIKGGGADDTRSDDEDDGEEEEEEDIEFEGPNPKAVEAVQMNGASMSTASFPSVIMNGGSHRHLSSQPLGGG